MSRETAIIESRNVAVLHRLPDFGTMRFRRMALVGGCPRRTSMAAIAIAGIFYPHGGIGLGRPESTAFTDINCFSTVRAALYGCGSGGDYATYRLRAEFGTIPAVELGLGYCLHSD